MHGTQKAASSGWRKRLYFLRLLALQLHNFGLDGVVRQDTIGEGHVATRNCEVEFTMLVVGKAAQQAPLGY